MGRFFSISHISADFIAVLVGYASSAAIVFQAAFVAGGSAAHASSWLWALGDEQEREAALVTFLCTASGVSLFGIASAFWGLVLGLVVMQVLSRR